MKVRHALAHVAPDQLRPGDIVVALSAFVLATWSQDTEILWVPDRGFNAKDGSGLVVHLYRIAVEPVLHPHALPPLPEARHHLCLPRLAFDSSEEPQDVRTLEMVYGMTDQRRVDAAQGGGVPEEQIGGPFRLIGHPPILHR
jgi:hypothetical protein